LAGAFISNPPGDPSTNSFILSGPSCFLCCHYGVRKSCLKAGQPAAKFSCRGRTSGTRASHDSNPVDSADTLSLMNEDGCHVDSWRIGNSPPPRELLLSPQQGHGDKETSVGKKSTPEFRHCDGMCHGHDDGQGKGADPSGDGRSALPALKLTNATQGNTHKKEDCLRHKSGGGEL